MNTNALRPLMMGVIGLLASLGLVLAVGQYNAVEAIDTTAACEGVGLTDGSTDCGDAQTAKDEVGSVIKTVVDILSLIVGAASVIVIIVSGLRFVTSGGDSARVASSRNTLLYAVVGLIIVIMAQVIVSFVVTSVDDGGITPTSSSTPPPPDPCVPGEPC